MKLFKMFKKEVKKVKMYKFVNINDATDIEIVDETSVNMFKVNDIDDVYQLVETFEA